MLCRLQKYSQRTHKVFKEKQQAAEANLLSVKEGVVLGHRSNSMVSLCAAWVQNVRAYGRPASVY